MLLYKNRSRTFEINKKYRVPHIRSQSLQQTFVSDLLNQGINCLIIKFLFGHAETSNRIRKFTDIQMSKQKLTQLNAWKNIDRQTKLLTKSKKTLSKSLESVLKHCN